MGLGEVQAVKEVLVYWPSGGVERWSDLAVDREIHIREGEGEAGP